MSEELGSGACPVGTVATHEPSQDVSALTGEYRLAGAVPSAGDLGARCAAAITPVLFEPAIKKVADELYMTLMESVQDYLCENVEGNIASTISSARREAARLNLEMWEIDKALGGASWQGTRAERIATLEANNNRYHTLLYAVASKFPGEDRHETALRYIREREAGSGIAASATGAA